jgi:IclR family pca regulon transcriptional regulator
MAMAQDEKPLEFVESLAKGLAIIEAFDADHPEMTLSEVARRAGISPAAARRGLHTLTALGYMRQVGKRFLLSVRVLSMGSAYLRAAHVEQALMPELRRIVGRFGDAASVSVLDGHNILYVAHYSEQRANRRLAGVGVTYPAYPTSMGRILLAGLPTAQLEAYFSVISPREFTEYTVTDPGRLRDIVRAARRDGYATVVDEFDYGVTALAVPIRGPDGRVPAALNSSGYTGRLKIGPMIAERLEPLRESAARLAEALERYPTLANSLADCAPGPAA